MLRAARPSQFLTKDRYTKAYRYTPVLARLYKGPAKQRTSGMLISFALPAICRSAQFHHTSAHRKS